MSIFIRKNMQFKKPTKTDNRQKDSDRDKIIE